MKFKILFAAAIFFVAGCLPFYTQTQTADNSQTVNQENNYVIPDETSVSLDTPAGNGDNMRTKSPVWAWVKMILVLALVVACIYFVMNYFRKTVSGPADSDDLFLRKVSQITLSPGKSVQIVSLLDKAYILGVSDNNINLITQIDDKELVQAMNANADRNAKVKKARNFEEILSVFLRSKSAVTTQTERDDVFKDSEQTMNNFFTEQTKRVRKTKK